MEIRVSTRLGAAAALTALSIAAQTMVDLRSQARNVDFSGALSTKPLKTGTALPAICEVGEAFFNINAMPGANVFLCTSTNVWAVVRGDQSLPSMSGHSGHALFNDGSNLNWAPALKNVRPGNAGGTMLSCVDGDCAVDVDTGYVATLGGNNLFSGINAFLPTPVQSLTDPANTITANGTTVQVAAPAALTLSSTPTIVDGANGQLLRIVNVHAASAITLQDETALSGSNLRLLSTAQEIGPMKVMTLMFIEAIGAWVQVGPVTQGAAQESTNQGVPSVFGRTGAVTAAKGDYRLIDLAEVSGKNGTSETVQMFGGGTVADGDCAKFDASGNLISAGSACGAGSGSTSKGFVIDSKWTGFSPATDSTRRTIASGTIPASTLAAGDRVVIRAIYAHSGGATLSPRPSVRFGDTDLISDGSISATDAFAFYQGEVLITGSSTGMGFTTLIRPNGAMTAPVRSAVSAAIDAPITVRFDGRFATGWGESLSLDWYSIEVVKR